MIWVSLNMAWLLLVPHKLVWDFPSSPGFPENGLKKGKLFSGGNALLVSEQTASSWQKRDTNQATQTSISERTTRQTVKQEGHTLKKNHTKHVLSKNRKLRWQLSFTTVRRVAGIAWFDETVIWCKQHESMKPSFLVSVVHNNGAVWKTTSSPYSKDLNSHQISVQWSSFGMRWRTSRMCSQQICSDSARLSRHCGPKSGRKCFQVLV